MLRHDRELPPRFDRLVHHVDAPEAGAPRARRDSCREHANRRRLPGAVRSEQPEDLTRTDLERHAVDRVEHGAAIALDKPLDFDSWRAAHVMIFVASDIEF